MSERSSQTEALHIDRIYKNSSQLQIEINSLKPAETLEFQA